MPVDYGKLRSLKVLGLEMARTLGLDIAVRNWRKYDTVTPIYSAAHFDLDDVRKAYYCIASGPPTASRPSFF